MTTWMNLEDTERQVPHDFTDPWNLKVKCIQAESRTLAARGGEGSGKWADVGQRVQSFSHAG